MEEGVYLSLPLVSPSFSLPHSLSRKIARQREAMWEVGWGGGEPREFGGGFCPGNFVCIPRRGGGVGGGGTHWQLLRVFDPDILFVYH